MVRAKIKHKELVKRMKEDELVKGIETLEDYWAVYIAPHLNRIIAGGVIIIVVGVIVWGVRSYLHTRGVEAFDQYEAAFKAFNDNDLDSARATSSSVTDNYAGTQAAVLANLLRGDVLFAQGQYAEALSLYRASQAKVPAVLSPLVKESQALAFESTKQYNEAEKIYADLLALAEFDQQKAFYHFRLGRIAEVQNRTDVALEHYRQIPEDTFYYYQAKNRITRLSSPVIVLEPGVEATESSAS